VALNNSFSLHSTLESDIKTELSKVLNSTPSVPLPNGEVDILNLAIAELIFSLVSKVTEINL
jgi:hypothetical protein